jgi:CheY-like chemotaxis protein
LAGKASDIVSEIGRLDRLLPKYFEAACAEACFFVRGALSQLVEHHPSHCIPVAAFWEILPFLGYSARLAASAMTDTTPDVLVIEDEPYIARMVAAIVGRLKYQVEVVSTGSNAVRRISEQNYSAIVLDLMLPDLGGFDIIEHIRQSKPELLKRVIVITASIMHLKKLGREQLGGMLEKPFDIHDLSALIRQAVLSAAREAR